GHDDDESTRTMEITRHGGRDRYWSREPCVAIRKEHGSPHICEAYYPQPSIGKASGARRHIRSNRHGEAYGADAERHKGQRHEPAMAHKFVFAYDMADRQFGLEDMHDCEDDEEGSREPK